MESEREPVTFSTATVLSMIFFFSVFFATWWLTGEALLALVVVGLMIGSVTLAIIIWIILNIFRGRK